ncbi:MAG: double-strand break repair protein AddB [Rhodobiaceae bacterium]|nr:double-strand break repair protein AddB [Rhodobiaceae bacterium]
MQKAGERTNPNVVSIPPGTAFLDCLAARLIDGTLLSGPPGRPCPAHDLVDATVLLPNRRAARVLVDRLLAHAGRPVMLPRIAAIGDIDEDVALIGEIEAGELADTFGAEGRLPLPPAVSTLERHLALTRLVYEFGQHKARALNFPGRSDGLLIPVGAADASALARDLARLLDALETEEIAAANLVNLVPENHAGYWDIAHRFLGIVVETWPHHLQERGLSDPIARRNALIRAETQRIANERPEAPLIIAGSTGSVPATAALMKVVAGLPRGWIVLPGLDALSDEASWEAIRAECTHPQYGLAQLLQSLELQRGDVSALTLPDGGTPCMRQELLTETFRPVATTDQWHAHTARADDEGCNGLAIINADTSREEALAIALALREAVEAGKPNAALVTPDRGLARRVSAELARWGLRVDDSAGQPLSSTPAGTFLRLVCEAVAQDLAPAPLAALLRHPLLRDADGDDATAARDTLEALALRGPRPAPGMAGLRHALEARILEEPLRNGVAARLRDKSTEEARALTDHLETALSALLATQRKPASFIETVARLRDAAITLSGGRDESGAPLLYGGDDGIRLMQFLDQVAESFDIGMRLPLASVPPFLASLMEGIPVRAHAHDRRIAILGPLEARLQQFGRVVLGGLNEGTWPGDTKTDPWLSRTMRAELGLDLPERRIGLAAHDVAQHMAGGDAVLTRSLRNEGSPTVASRWLQRLEAVIGKDAYRDLAARGERYLGWARDLDHSQQDDPPKEPAPCPPLAARPRRLSVTQAETLIRDPYAIYASKILKLDPLPGLDEDADAALRGSLVHDAIARFVEDTRSGAPVNPVRLLTQLFEEEMGTAGIAPHTRALWRPRLMRIAHWFADYEADRRAKGYTVAGLEADGALSFDAPGGAFKLTARADRIDLSGDGTLALLDYKTGAPPTAKQVSAGLAPQLTLEAAIAARGGFDAIAALPAGELVYIRLSGGAPAGDVRGVASGAETMQLAEEALEGFSALVRAYDDANLPYRPRVSAMLARAEESYDHLSRYREWSTADGGSGDGE